MTAPHRTGRALATNVDDSVDTADDPERKIGQTVIEMAGRVDVATQALGQAMGSQKVAAKELACAKAVSAGWNDRARLALRAGDEDLARRALEAKVGIDSRVAQLQTAYESITAQVDKLRDQVCDLGLRLDEARARQSILAARSGAAVTTSVDAVVASVTPADGLTDLDRKAAANELLAALKAELGL